MADRVTQVIRSHIMASVGRKNTKPEMLVRSIVHRLGYRFRLHSSDLPGTPDIVLPRYMKVIFVHGCFWHGHDCSKGLRRPQTNEEFWNAKVKRNMARDRRNLRDLRKLGWSVLTVWECELKNKPRIVKKLEGFLL